MAILIGVPFGVLIGWSRTFARLFDPFTQSLRPIPITAWLRFAFAPGQSARTVEVALEANEFVVVDVDRLPLHEQTDAFAEAEARLRDARDEQVILVLLVPAFNKIHAACLRCHADIRCATSALGARRPRRARGRQPPPRRARRVRSARRRGRPRARRPRAADT